MGITKTVLLKLPEQTREQVIGWLIRRGLFLRVPAFEIRLSRVAIVFALSFFSIGWRTNFFDWFAKHLERTVESVSWGVLTRETEPTLFGRVRKTSSQRFAQQSI